MRTILVLATLAGLGLAAGAVHAAGRGPDGLSAPATADASPVAKPAPDATKGGKGKGKG